MSSATQEIGKVIGKYKILEVIGEGGMGVVYKVRHTLIGKKAALKMLHNEFAARPAVVERFFREATAVNKIQHQNIVDISDYGQTQNGRCYFIMELLEGRELARELEPARPMDLRRAFHIVLQISSALRASHRAGIIHRDIKPDNIFLVHLGADPDFVKVLDFGISKLLEDSGPPKAPDKKTILQEEYLRLKERPGAPLPAPERAHPVTQLGAMLGTPGYMAPEQIEGASVDARADIYALGMIFYELLTGGPAFYAESDEELMRKVLSGALLPPTVKNPYVPKEFEALILKAAQKERGRRFQSTDDLIEALYQAEIKAVGRGEMAPAMILASSSMSLPVVSLSGHGSGGYPAARSGEFPAHRPPLVLPSPPATETSPLLLPRRPTKPPQSQLRRTVQGALFSALVIALFLAVTHFFAPRPEGESEPAVASPPPPPTTLRVPKPKREEKVKIAVLSEPAGALVTEGDLFWGKTPCLLELAPSPAPRTIRLSLEGHAPQTKTFVPDEDQSLYLTLPERKEEPVTKSERAQKKGKRVETPAKSQDEVPPPQKKNIEGTIKVKF